MTDTERVIKNLEDYSACEKHDGYSYERELIRDALEIIKNQQEWIKELEDKLDIYEN